MLRTGQSPAPSQGRSSSASTPGSHPTPGVLLPGTLASPRTGLTPAGCRELVARLRRGTPPFGGPRRPSCWTHTPAESPCGGSSRPAGLAPAAPGGRRGRRPAPPGPGSRAAVGGPAGTPRALDPARWRRGTGPGGRDNGRSASGGRGPDVAPAPPARPFHAPHCSGPTRLIGTCPVLFGARGSCRNAFWTAAENPAGCPRPVSRAGDDGVGWEDGGMPDPMPLVDLASLAAGGGHSGARWRLDGEDLQANLVRLDRGDRIPPHRNDEVEVLVVVVSGRGELTLDGQVHQVAPMVLAHLPKGTVRAIDAVDGPLAYLSVHRRRPAGTAGGSARPATLRSQAASRQGGQQVRRSARCTVGHGARSS
jgi:quercetin dioxygenase-like cupin family protein